MEIAQAKAGQEGQPGPDMGGEQAQQSNAQDDDIVDAEFEEVDNDKK